MSEYPHCSITGKRSFPSASIGYAVMRKVGKKSFSKKVTDHMYCKHCNAYHMVTVNKR